MKKIIVIGPALSASGYGEQTRFALRSLKSQSNAFDIYLKNINWGKTSWISDDDEERVWLDRLIEKTNLFIQNKGAFDISLQVTIPNEWEKVAPINIGYTAGCETNKISPTWIEKCNIMDKIIVVSSFTKSVFDETWYSAIRNETGEQVTLKCEVPVEYANYPFKEVEPEKSFELDLDFDFNFLTVAMWSPRKNIENTIKWFVEEFYDKEVGLVAKVSSAKNSHLDSLLTQQKIQNILNKYPDRKCKVYMLHGDLTKNEMTSLYQHPKVKALINIGHGEGFGLPMFEAAYNELPVIACGWSGHCDFLFIPKKKKNGKVKNTPYFAPVDFRIDTVQKEAHWETIIDKDSKWCFPDQGSYKMTLRKVLSNYDQYKDRARSLNKWIRENFTAEAMYKNFADHVHRDSAESLFWDGKINEMEMM